MPNIKIKKFFFFLILFFFLSIFPQSVWGAIATEPSFSDEFNGTAVNTLVWQVFGSGLDMGCQMSKTRCYTDGNYLNLELVNDGGVCLGSAIQTKVKYGYGKWETRIKTSPVSGVINAFFTIDWPTTRQEVDLEFPTKIKPTFLYPNAHLAVHALGLDSWDTRPDISMGFNPSDDFHIYTMEINLQKIIWSVDSRILGEYVYADNDITINATYQLKMNHWTSTNSWVGGFPALGVLGKYQIDYVKFYPYIDDLPSDTVPPSAPAGLSVS